MRKGGCHGEGKEIAGGWLRGSSSVTVREVWGECPPGGGGGNMRGSETAGAWREKGRGRERENAGKMDDKRNGNGRRRG